MAFRTTIRQGCGVRKNMARFRNHLAGFIQGQFSQILDLMTHATSLRTYFLSIQPILVAVFTGLVCGKFETAIRHFPMTIRASAAILDNVLIVAEGELEAVFFVTANHQYNRHQAEGRRLKH